MEKASLEFIGYVRSSLKHLTDCPLQGNEGAPEALLEIAPRFIKGLEGLKPGSELVLLTWLHAADRSVLKCHVRNNIDSDKVGVFTTRSPDRPNPVGLHQVKVLEIAGEGRIKVHPLEALDGTPLIDIKPVW